MKLMAVTYETNKSLWGYDAFYFVRAKKATRHKELLCFEIRDEAGNLNYAWILYHNVGWLLWGMIPHRNWCGPLDWRSTVDALEPCLSAFISLPSLP